MIDDLIERLPKAIQAMVRAHLETVILMEFEKQQEFVNLIIAKHFNGAYEMLNSRLTPSERLDEQKRLNRMMQDWNIENKAVADMWRNFFAALISIALQKAFDKIIGS